MTSTYEHMIMYWRFIAGVKPVRSAILATMVVLVASDCSAKPARHRHVPAPAREHAARPAGGVDGGGVPFAGEDDTLYRTRGYGIGGVPFSLGGGDLALSGACAQVANRNPACGPAGGYGIYGNGLGYGTVR